jgi:hypothetical protein
MKRILMQSFESDGREEFRDERLLVVGRRFDAVLTRNQVFEAIKGKLEIDGIQIRTGGDGWADVQGVRC